MHTKTVLRATHSSLLSRRKLFSGTELYQANEIKTKEKEREKERRKKRKKEKENDLVRVIVGMENKNMERRKGTLETSEK